jgi:hypothetical protein
LYFNPQEVLHSSATEPGVVVEWLFTNAPRFYGDVDDLAEFAETLATVDAWDQNRFLQGSSEASGPPWDSLGVEVQALGLLDANLHPIKPTFGDPSASSEKEGDRAFNMVRPRLRDISRHQLRRSDMMAASIGVVGPHAFGRATPGAALLIRTFPFVHLMLAYSRGQHASLRHLPHGAMKTIMELSSFDGNALARPEEKWGADVAEVWNSHKVEVVATSLPDDPIEDFE